MFIGFQSCSQSNEPMKEIVINQSDIVKRTFEVHGMTCVGCEVTLEETVSDIEGVVTTKADHSNNNLVIEFDSTKTDVLSIKNAIKDLGYKIY